MKLHDFHSDAIDELRNIHALSFIGRHEEYESERELVAEALSRDSAASRLAFENGTIDYSEFAEEAEALKKFCEKYGYDFYEYCYSPEDMTANQEAEMPRRNYL